MDKSIELRMNVVGKRSEGCSEGRKRVGRESGDTRKSRTKCFLVEDPSIAFHTP